MRLSPQVLCDPSPIPPHVVSMWVCKWSFENMLEFALTTHWELQSFDFGSVVNYLSFTSLEDSNYIMRKFSYVFSETKQWKLILNWKLYTWNHRKTQIKQQ